MNNLIKPAKQALAQEFGHKNVSVKNGTGTSWGWVVVRITTDKEEEIRDRAMGIMKKAWEEEGLKPYTFTSDSGYDNELECVLISVDR